MQHMFPQDDFIDHEPNLDCVCGPRQELTYLDNGRSVIDGSLEQLDREHRPNDPCELYVMHNPLNSEVRLWANHNNK